jgi:hypothetical protein
MSDVGFSQNGGLQDGTGNPDFMNFIHDYVSLVGVCFDPIFRILKLTEVVH